MKKFIFIIIFLSICICSYASISLTTIRNDIDAFNNFIEKEYGNGVDILEITQDDNNIFLLCKQNKTNKIMVLSFKRNKILRNRCSYQRESSTQSHYDLSILKEHNENNTETLWILYGENENLKAKDIYLYFNDSYIKEDISNKKYFIFTYRFLNESYIPDIVFK